MSKQPPPAPPASTIDPCPLTIRIVGRPGTETLPRTTATPDNTQKVSEIIPCSLLTGNDDSNRVYYGKGQTFAWLFNDVMETATF